MHPFTTTNADVERYSPPEIVAAARETLGGIDLDPCTTELVNRTFIRASHIYTKETDGLNREACPWIGRTYINAPSRIYLTRGTQTTDESRNGVRMFWERLMTEYLAKRITAGVFMAFDITALQQSQGWNHMMVQYPFCIPEKRLIFWRKKNGLQALEERDHPEFASAIIYVGKSVKRFSKAFENIGAVIIPRITNPRTTATLTNWNGEPIAAGLTAPPIEGCERDPQASTQERFGIHCGLTRRRG